jgi:UPF0755 protein
VSDAERSAQEREAARLERERRRAGLFNQDDSAPAEPPATEQYSPFDGHDDLEEYEHPDDGYEDGAGDGAPAETPSGTRRVSRLEAPPAARGRRAPSGRQPKKRPKPAPGRRSGRSARSDGNQRAHSWVGRGLAVAGLLLVAAVIWFAIELYQPFGTSPHGQVTIVVPAHAGSRQIGDLLAKEGVVPSGFFFEIRAALSGEHGKLRSGAYRLQQGMSYGAVLTKLTTAPPAARTTDLTITPGHTRGQVAALLRKQGIKGNYLAATRHSPLIDPRAYGAPRNIPSLEGFLFPDTFSVVEPVKLSALVDDQLRDFKQRFATVNMSYARSKNLTPYDVLKIASLIEAEAASPRDRLLIASVIYNRLAKGMMLQFDSTARYATGNFTKPLTVSQLGSRSPYNTHTHLGLPPTPIDSPSLASIQAAAHPAKTDYLFFFTKPCNAGSSVYTSNYPEFEHLLAVDRRNHC